MNKKVLFSSFGLAAIALILLLSVLVVSFLPSLRIDLTEDRLYSLSDGTRNILASLNQPVELMFFYSDSATEDVPQLRTYGNRVQELLREIVIASEGNLRLSVIDPEPFSEEEDLATQFGVRAVPVTQGGEGVYFGLVAAQDEEGVPEALRVTETMPLIRPDQEEFLEYEFMKIITQVTNPERTIIGLITQLGLLNPFNRKQESEADYLGMIFSSLSGYDIRETVKIWERMKKLNKGKEPPEFMSTHPSSSNRIKDLNEKMNGVILDYPPLDIS